MSAGALLGLAACLLSTAVGGDFSVSMPLGTQLEADEVSVTVVPLPPEKSALVFMGWDGGPRSDLRLSGLLEEYNLPASFFLFPGCPMEEHLATLMAHGMEIGSVGVSERNRFSVLSSSRIDYELRASRAHLEMASGREVVSFSYPFQDLGFRSWMRNSIAERLVHAGYRNARVANRAVLSAALTPRMAILRGIDVPAFHVSDELFLLSALDDMALKGNGYGAGMWAHSWEVDAKTPGESEFRWGDMAGLLRKIADEPGVHVETFAEAASDYRRASAVRVGPGRVDGDHVVVSGSVDEGALNPADAGPISLLLHGVHADTATVNGVAARAVDGPAGTRVALVVNEARPPAPACERAPESWQLSLACTEADVPTAASLHLAGDLTDAHVRAVLDVPHGWAVDPAEVELDLPKDGSVDQTFALTPPAAPAADDALFLARVTVPTAQGERVRLVPAHVSIPPTPDEAARVLCAGMIATFREDASLYTEGTEVPLRQPPTGYFEPYPDVSLYFSPDYVDLGPIITTGAQSRVGRVYLRTVVEIPSARPLKLDVVSTGNLRLWWDGELVSRLDSLPAPQARAEALAPIVAFDNAAAGSHELAVEFQAKRGDSRDECGFFAFFLDDLGRPYEDIRFRRPE